MLTDLLTSNTIQINEGSDLSWEDAIRLSAKPLESSGFINQSYVDEMVSIVKSKGPYFNIGPEIALAHARPEAGANKISLSLLKTDHEISLVDETHPIKLWFVLSATDNNSHLELIQELMTLLMDKQKVQQMCDSKSVEELKSIVNV
ncbi:PTS sugar transporter subunit IIA [Paucilactobacillus nenjiangensis]|jgi:PTS system ascorbate-specific IIA component|uniref:PTS sugar transporter subunit IIA n=2 Tax=Lactobacillaceae TaxID=33958 RepID=UPI0010F6AC00|nr:PTS sugar transporter subunit IIA [Paucilactobacillus nenjiangensis]